MLNRFFTVSLLALASCTTAFGQAAFDNYTTNPVFAVTGGVGGVEANQPAGVGQSFTTGLAPTLLMGVQFPQVMGDAGGGNYTDAATQGETFTLYTDATTTLTSGDDHPGTAVTTFTLSHVYYSLGSSTPPPTGTPFGLTTATLAIPTLLLPGTRYWLVLSAPSPSSNLYWGYSADSTDPASPFFYTSNSPSGITLPTSRTSFDSTYDPNTQTTTSSYFDYNDGNYADGPQFLIINAVPEPSTYCLLAVAGLALVVSRKRSSRVV